MRIILMLLVIFTLIGCKDNAKENYKNSDGSDKFICTVNNFSDFIITSSSLDKNYRPYSIVKAFSGKIKNNTKTIFKKAIMTPEIIFELENGNTLSSADIDITKSLGGNPEFKIISNWKPNEEWNIDYLETCSFSVEYVDYPIKSVYSQYYIEVEDQINNTNENILVSQRNITDLWKKVVKKVKEGKVDTDDYPSNKEKFIQRK